MTVNLIKKSNEWANWFKTSLEGRAHVGGGCARVHILPVEFSLEFKRRPGPLDDETLDWHLGHEWGGRLKGGLGRRDGSAERLQLVVGFCGLVVRGKPNVVLRVVGPDGRARARREAALGRLVLERLVGRRGLVAVVDDVGLVLVLVRVRVLGDVVHGPRGVGRGRRGVCVVVVRRRRSRDGVSLALGEMLLVVRVVRVVRVVLRVVRVDVVLLDEGALVGGVPDVVRGDAHDGGHGHGQGRREAVRDARQEIAERRT